MCVCLFEYVEIVNIAIGSHCRRRKKVSSTWLYDACISPRFEVLMDYKVLQIPVESDESHMRLVRGDIEVVHDVLHRHLGLRQLFSLDTLRRIHNQVHVHLNVHTFW